MAIQLKDKSVSDELNRAMQNEGEIRLPFPAPVLWVLNGSRSLKQIGGVQYFGGWASHAEDFEQAANEMGKPVPPFFVKQEFTPRNGEKIDIYTARAISCVPIAKRLSSVEKITQVRYPGYHKGASPHLQVLVYLSYKDSTSKEPLRVNWGTAILSAKGFQAGNLLDAFAKWQSITAKARHDFAPGLSANLFVCGIGTFGNEPEIKQVGTGETSPITPIKLYEPKTLDENQLQFLFIGDELAGELVALRSQAKDWMDAWKKPTSPKTDDAETAEFETVAEAEEESQEDIPF